LGAGAVLLCLATILDAYGTHALAARLSPAALRGFATAVDYQFIHGLGLIATAILSELRPECRAFRWAGWMLIAGVVLFSGSIYGTTFGAPAAFGRAAPIGGSLLIVAWLTLALGAWTARPGGATDTLA
jgi:uncharacterized membrane protein YgdD (TMEM256/DUF423 family)